jgi:hypothetical protein
MACFLVSLSNIQYLKELKMKPIKRTKENPLISIVYFKSGPRRVCRWFEDGRYKTEFYARRLWKSVKGEIPKGYFIHYKDGDKMNDCIENYELVRFEGLSEYEKFLKHHDRMDNAQKNKYRLRWMELEGNTALEKLNTVLAQYEIKNFHQFSELTDINEGQINRIKNKNTGLGMINVKRLFDAIDNFRSAK